MKNKKQRDEEKKRILSETENLTIQQQKEKAQQGLFSEQADALTPKQLQKNNKEKEKELIQLIGGGVTSIKERKDFAASQRQPYQSHFGQETGFFTGIYRLKSWPLGECKKFVKRREVALIINRLIYNRYHPDVVTHIKKENPFIFSYIRKFKHSQYITKEGQKYLDSFVVDFTMMMIGYSDWDKFEYDYCVKYNLSYQLKTNL